MTYQEACQHLGQEVILPFYSVRQQAGETSMGNMGDSGAW